MVVLLILLMIPKDGAQLKPTKMEFTSPVMVLGATAHLAANQKSADKVPGNLVSQEKPAHGKQREAHPAKAAEQVPGTNYLH